MRLAWARRLAVALGFALLVAFAPSTAWADSGPVSLGLEPSAVDAAPAVVDGLADSPAAAAYLSGVGTQADPTIVEFGSDYQSAVLLALSLLVFTGAATLISVWGN